MLGWTNGLAAFAGGNLPNDFSTSVMPASRDRLVSTNAEKLTLWMARANGFFRGGAKPYGGSSAISARGVLLQKTESGHGYFWYLLQTSTTGSLDARDGQ
jgi:hypothetical protein